MPRSNSRATVRSLVSVGILEVPHARRPHARLGQPVVEPGRHAAAEVGADRLVDGRAAPAGGRTRPRRRRAARPGSRPAAPRRRARPWRPRTPPAARRAAEARPTRRSARPRSARGRTAKNFHSGRSRSRRSMDGGVYDSRRAGVTRRGVVRRGAPARAPGQRRYIRFSRHGDLWVRPSVADAPRTSSGSDELAAAAGQLWLSR